MSNIYRFDTETPKHKSFELPGARPHYTPDRPGQVDHIALDLMLDIPQKRYKGTCRINLTPVRSGIEHLVLDAVNLRIDSVMVGNLSQSFDHDGEQLHVALSNPTTAGKTIELAIAYHSDNPQRGLYFVAPTEAQPGKPIQVWTQGEDEDSRYWFPCFDYPGQLATSEIRVRVPKPYQAISNGELVETSEEGDSKIFHWVQKQVHPSYLMTLAVGDFDEIRDEWDGIPVTYYAQKGRGEDAQRTMGKTPEMLQFFSDRFGYRYAFPKYAQVCIKDFTFGGMENTSCTLLTDRCLLDERAALDNINSEMLVAHELAHQWFGDLLVINHWSHAWVKEGMATYSEVLWTHDQYGADEAAYYRLGEMQSYLSEDKSRYRRPMVTNIYREPIELYDRHIYEKGACVYHMIRTELGDELFWQAIHGFVNRFAHKTVETLDLIRTIEETTGRNLRFLFDQYVYRGGHPDFTVAYRWDAESHLAKVTVTQTQAKAGDKSSQSGLFDLRIPIGFGYVEGDHVTVQPTTIRIHEQEQALYFSLPQKPDFISFDVGNHYTKTVKLEYPLPELKAQLKHDPDPISRVFAAEAIAQKGGLEAVQALAEALTQDSFWGIRAEAAQRLAELKLDQATAALLQGLQDTHPKVRRAVVTALGTIKTPESYQALSELVQAGDASYYVESTAAQSLGDVGATKLPGIPDTSETLVLLQTLLKERAGWNEVVRSGALSGVSRFKTSEAALEIIVQYTEPTVPSMLRLGAVRALGKISTGQTKANVERILEQLEAISREPQFTTQMTVISALGMMETAGAVGVLQGIADHIDDGRVRRRAEEAVQRVQKKLEKDAAIEKLQQDLEEVKKSNRELKSRLEELEAKGK
ncbi:M1 family metallopeptidase [Oscillatoria sp. CS-180]|uniref:M1 family metallopeptidase n=1 Tax=Oscillatoria sp. CS-180 TaxID=3021720 RepID=UPI00232E9C6E|nr:M1 family metallopeptidase [Oscillatoria sp. CS-180]MDB9526031.1 M1 family metallopeptidase [Oscillatoria sp. CS-180]